MCKLDRSKFCRRVPLVVAKVENPKLLNRICKLSAPGDLLQMKKVPRIVQLPQHSEEQPFRGVLLSACISCKDDALSKLSQSTLDALSEAKFTLQDYTLDLEYEHWSADEILRAVLPPSAGDAPTSFSAVGHIAHLNLRDQFLPYKQLIGQVILDKNQPAIRTVVNKLDTIDTVFRTFEMEVVAGEPDFEVEQSESGCRFKFDFRKVYWNSRLHTEHERLVQEFGSGAAVCDPFAGVGPFAIPAAKHGNLVFANDLNPNSYEAMIANAKLNKLPPKILQAYNEDAREFIRESVVRLHAFRAQNGVVSIPPSEKARRHLGAKPLELNVPDHFSHYVMNLPATAIEFLDAFRGLYTHAEFSTPPPPPLVHVHCFHKFDPHAPEPTRTEVEVAIAARISKALGHGVDRADIALHNVRRVAPSKDMYAASFAVPHAVLYAP